MFLKELSKEKQKEILGYEAAPEYKVYMADEGYAIFINKNNGNVAFEIASEELPFEVIEEIYNLAKKYKK